MSNLFSTVLNCGTEATLVIDFKPNRDEEVLGRNMSKKMSWLHS